MISNILTNFFNCFTVPTLLLNYNFQIIFTHNHDSKIDISFYTSKAIEIVKNLNFISNTTSFNITNDISFSCISFNHYDNSKMYLLIGPYSTKELSNNNSEINILTEEWINNIIKLHTYIISNHIGKFNNLQNISPCVNHAIKYIEKNYSNEILIDDICAELNINKCYFCSVFKKETGLTFINYLNNYGEDLPIDIMYKEKDENLDRAVELGVSLKAGAYEILSNLKNNNFKIALATSAAKERALKQLKQADIEKFFDVIISRDDVKETKPNPEIFLKAAEKLNVLPSECIVIEDSSAGIRAAFNARMIAIHVVDLKEADEDILNHCYNSYKNLNEIQKVLIKK